MSDVLNVYYRPHARQKEVHASKAKYRVVAAGRKSGKSTCAVADLLMQIQKGGSKPLSLAWVSPTYYSSARGLGMLKVMARDLIKAGQLKVTGKAPAEVTWGAHTISFLSADRPDSIRPYDFDGMVIDEAAFLEDEAFEQVLLPTLMRHDGRLLMISSPKGKHGFFSKFFHRTGDPQVESFKMTPYDNPHVKPKVIDELRKQMSEASFREEVLADFLGVASSIVSSFDGLEDCDLECTHKSGKVMGLDLARLEDYTVGLCVCPICHVVTGMLRMTKLDWADQLSRISGFYEAQGRPEMVVDANSIGDVVISALKGARMRVTPFKITASSKKDLVNALIISLERKLVRWDGVRLPEISRELSTYKPQVTPSGSGITWNAEKGCHDDVVTALALACTRLVEERHAPFFHDLADMATPPSDEGPRLRLPHEIVWSGDEDDAD